MAPRRARYARIERIVDLLLRQASAGPPVAVEAMVRQRHIDLRKGDLGDVSGFLLRGNERTTIGVNARESHRRQRFTIAHEFGHFLLHDGIVEHVDRGYRIARKEAELDSVRINYRSEVSSLATDVEEIEANFFAACLLMPRHLLDASSALFAVDDDQKVKELAEEFDVSGHAMSLRLANVYRRHAPY